MKKKALKITGTVLFLFVALLVALPLLLKGKIADVIKNKVNTGINAAFDFEEADLSLFKNFPSASISLKGISLANHAPFKGDTLFSAYQIELKMGMGELIKSTKDPISIKSLSINKAKLHIKVDKEENANYDVGRKTGGTSGPKNMRSGFRLALETYEILDSEIIYDDFSSGIHLEISEMDHSGTGDLSSKTSELKTLTNALVSFELDSARYLNDNKIFLDALIGIDLENNKYSFMDNRAMINQLPLVFEGFFQTGPEGPKVDVRFKTPSSDFRNFLAVIPEAYSKNIENVKTTGNFTVNGVLKGIVDEEHIPTFNIELNSNSASFKYPDLSQTVKNIVIDAAIANTTGITEDTYVDIKKLAFTLGQDRFNANSHITDLLGNTKVNAHVDGKINLRNLSKAYPMPDDYGLKGILNANVTTAFDMESVQNKQYGRTKTLGTMEISDFEYASEELKNPLAIGNASMTFNPRMVTLNSFEGKTGQTDFAASGTLTNLLGFLFNEEDIQGDFDLSSNRFAVNDFMVAESTEESVSGTKTPESGEKFKIPSFLDCTINARADKVLYDNLALDNVQGTLVIKDETATLKGFRSDLFAGTLGIQGSVSTKEEIPTFAMSLGMNDFNIGESFQAFDLFRVVAPIATALEGKLNSDIEISGNLKDDLTPNLSTISGNVLAELLATQVNAQKAPLLSVLDAKLGFLDTKNLDLSNLKTALSIDNGTVTVKPFTVNYKDIAVNIGGSHTFDRQMQYKATLDVPARYLGSQVNNLIAQLDGSELEDLTIPVTANINGTYTDPKVSTDLSAGVSKLTYQLVEVQKQKLLGKGKDTAGDLLSNVSRFEGQDSTSTEKPSTKGVIGTLLGEKKKTATDSAKTQKDPVKTTAKSILGGLLGRRKKDTVN